MSVVDKALKYVGTKTFVPFGGKSAIASKGMCEAFSRTPFGFKAKYASADEAFKSSAADGRIHNSTDAPAGVPVFFEITTGPNKKFGHVAISVGGGYCVSTSVGVGGTVARVKIADFGTKIWRGAIRLRGWAEYYHGVKVYKSVNSKPLPEYDLSDVKLTKTQIVKLQEGMNKIFPSYSDLLVDGDYGQVTANAVAEFQRRAGLVVDGVAGPITLAALAGFGVKVK